MHQHRSAPRTAASLAAALLLSACSGSTSTSPVTPPLAPPASLTRMPSTAATEPTSSALTTATTVGNSTAAPTLLNEDPNKVFGSTSAWGTIVGKSTSSSIDGLNCTATMGDATHYHVHVSVGVNGHAMAIPAGTGIHNPVVQYQKYFVEPNPSGGCVYPIHVHALMGLVHIESFTSHFTATLGEFLDVWGQTLSTSGFGKYAGTTRWFDTDETKGGPGTHPVVELTGKDPHLTPLYDHHEYTIEVGPTFVPTPNFTFSSSYP